MAFNTSDKWQWKYNSTSGSWGKKRKERGGWNESDQFILVQIQDFNFRNWIDFALCHWYHLIFGSCSDSKTFVQLCKGRLVQNDDFWKALMTDAIMSTKGRKLLRKLMASRWPATLHNTTNKPKTLRKREKKNKKRVLFLPWQGGGTKKAEYVQLFAHTSPWRFQNSILGPWLPNKHPGFTFWQGAPEWHFTPQKTNFLKFSFSLLNLKCLLALYPINLSCSSSVLPL